MPAPELTFLACPKPFVGHVAVTQRNAITSWARLTPRPRIVLFGDETGTADIARELEAIHVPDVRRNDRGTPLLDDLFAHGRRLAAGGGPWCFINADIILMDDFQPSLERIAHAKAEYLVIGRRTDLDVTSPIAFDDPHWSDALRRSVSERGRLHGEDGIDYFVFTPGLFDPVPPLLVGRASIDNWLVFRARRRWRAVIDATASITAVHQNHDYSHHPDGRFGVYHGEEAQKNFTLAGGHDHLFWISDRTHRLTGADLRLDRSAAQLRRHWDRLPVLLPPGPRQVVRLLHMLQHRVGDLLRFAGLRKALPTRQ